MKIIQTCTLGTLTSLKILSDENYTNMYTGYFNKFKNCLAMKIIPTCTLGTLTSLKILSDENYTNMYTGYFSSKMFSDENYAKIQSGYLIYLQKFNHENYANK